MGNPISLKRWTRNSFIKNLTMGKDNLESLKAGLIIT